MSFIGSSNTTLQYLHEDIHPWYANNKWHHFKRKRWLLLMIPLSLLVGFGVAKGTIYIEDLDNNKSYPVHDAISHLISFTPLVALQLALGIPSVLQMYRTFISHRGEVAATCILPAFLTYFLLIGSVLVPKAKKANQFIPVLFSPLSIVYAFCFAAFSLGALRRAHELSPHQMTYIDACVWLLLWVLIDYRWFNDLYFGAAGQGYNWWASAFTLMLIIGFVVHRHGIEGMNYRLIPNLRDFAIMICTVVAQFAVVIPIGLATNFLRWENAITVDFLSFISVYMEIFVTVALTEELFFRVILYNGLLVRTKSKFLATLLSSAAFALMHWPRMHDLELQIIYLFFAMYSGVILVFAYHCSGRNIIAGAMAHALGDTLWGLFFGGYL